MTTVVGIFQENYKKSDNPLLNLDRKQKHLRMLKILLVLTLLLEKEINVVTMVQLVINLIAFSNLKKYLITKLSIYQQ